MRALTSILVVIAALLPAYAADEVTPKDLIAKAKQGDGRAQMALAYRYRDGNGVARDYVEAMRWAHPVADQGDAGAMDFVGWMYFEGLGVKRSPEIAAGYFKAASGRSASGAWNLGQCYFAGLGVEQNVSKALEAWKRAAAMGHGRSASTAAMVYLAGEGIAPDGKEARRLAQLAADLNDPAGLVVLGEIHFQTGDVEKARASWTKVADQAGRTHRAADATERSTVCDNGGRPAEAARVPRPEVRTG